MKSLSKCLIIFFIGISVLSCSNDDDTVATITGNWEIFEVSFKFQENGQATFEQTFSTNECNAPFIFSFADNGILTLSDVEFDLDESTMGNIEIDCFVSNQNIVGTWQLQNNNMYLFGFDGDTEIVEVNFDNDTIEIISISSDFDDYDNITYTETVIFRGNAL